MRVLENLTYAPYHENGTQESYLITSGAKSPSLNGTPAYLKFSPERSRWLLVDRLTNQEVASYRETEVRMALVWRSHCFRDEDEWRGFRERSDIASLDMESILQVGTHYCNG